MKGRRIALTGGIACGKSLVARYLNEFGVETIDADDIVHRLIPDPAERKRIAAEVFKDDAKRRELEARLHPLVKAALEKWAAAKDRGIGIEIIPLLFETHWDGQYDIICSVVAGRETQIARMMTTRGYTREEALGRLAAQMPAAEKAEKSHYVIHNDGTAAELKEQVDRFVTWLKS